MAYHRCTRQRSHRCTRQRGHQLDLDDDSWCLIFDKLNSRKDQNSFGLTCHRFLSIQNLSLKCLKIGCPYMYYTPKCSKKHPKTGILMVNKLLNRFTQLNTLSLGPCLTNVIYKPCLNVLQKHGSRLKSVDLNHCRRLTNKGFTSLASGCPLLSVISLAHSNVTDKGLENLTRSCKYLKEVNLTWCENVTDRGLLSINQNCRQLRALIISGCREICRLSFSPTLSCLDAKYCDFNSTGIVSGSGSCIEYLNLPFLGISPAGLGLGFASKLKILSFYGSCSVEDDDIIKISRGCPLLQHWNLTSCVNLGIAAWDSIGSYCRNLETLHVCDCEYFCDTGLLAIGTGCKRLSVIYIDEGCCVTFDGVGMFRLQRPDVEIKDDKVHDITPSWAFTTTIPII